MKNKTIKKTSLKKTLIKTHLSIAGIGTILLIISLIAIIRLETISNQLITTNLPLTTLMSDIKSNLQSSLANLRGWINIDNPNFQRERHANWNTYIIPDLNSLESILSKKQKTPLQPLVSKLHATLRDLNMWQWRIEDVAHKPENKIARFFLKERVTPSYKNMINLSNNLSHSQRNNKIVNDSLIYNIANIKAALRSFMLNLNEYITSNNTFQLNEVNISLSKIQLTLGKISDQKQDIDSSQQNSITDLQNQFHSLIQLKNQLINIHNQASNDIALDWLQHKAIPLANQASTILNLILHMNQQNDTSQLATLNELSHAIIITISIFIGLLILLSLGLALFNSKLILKPIRSLSYATQQLAQGKLNHNIPINREDELGELTHAFNVMREQRIFAENKTRAVIETATDAIISIDSSGSIVSCNKATLQLFGYQENELLGKNISILMPEPYQSKHDSYIQNYLKTKQKHIIGSRREVTAVTKSKKIIPIMLSVNEIRVENDISFTGIIHDLTEEKQQQAREEKIKEDLFHLQKLETVSTLAGGLAHDFNNILFVISGLIELQMKRLKESHLDTELLSRTQKSLDHGAVLIRQLLDFSRNSPPQQVALQINPLIKETAELLSTTLQKSVTIQLELAPELPDISADKNQLLQVFLNLGNNANDAMPEGGTLTLRSTTFQTDTNITHADQELPAGSYVQVSIKDTGSGIPDDLLKKIYEPFFTTKQVGKGTGLGLAMIYGIIQRHKAIITVESQPNQGTTFTIFFPITTQANQTEDAT